jgi:hypothetical protein
VLFKRSRCSDHNISLVVKEKKMHLNPKTLKAAASDLARGFGVSEPDIVTNAVAMKTVREAEQEMRKERVRLLFELANLPCDSPRLQKLLERFDPIPQEAIALLQKTLQMIWRRDVPLDTKQYLANVLYVGATRSPYCVSGGLHPNLAMGSLFFAGRNLPGQVLTGILEHWPSMAHCANPECQAPYFFAKRSTQVYCERGECTKYAIRKKALKWWEENRGKGSKKQKASKKRNRGGER